MPPRFGTAIGDGAVVLVALAVAVGLWSPFHNALRDLLEWRCAQRVASRCPRRLRIAHAITHEVSTVIVTLPFLKLLGGHGFWEALLVNLGLSFFLCGYAYVFHLAYDRLRPVVMVAAGR